MGKSTTVTYRIEMDGCTPMQWKREHGRPTDENLAVYVRHYAKSLELGGVNQHVSLALGYVPYPNWAKVIRQSSGKVVAEWKAGAFQVW